MGSVLFVFWETLKWYSVTSLGDSQPARMIWCEGSRICSCAVPTTPGTSKDLRLPGLHSGDTQVAYNSRSNKTQISNIIISHYGSTAIEYSKVWPQENKSLLL